MQRGWLDNVVLAGEPYCRRAAWIWLIENAAWRDTVVKIDGKPVTLERGELSFSERYLAEAWRWPRSRVHRFLTELATWGMIRPRSARDQNSDHHTDRLQNILALCNYRKYQDGVTVSAPQLEPSPNHLRTISEPKKKEVKKEEEDSSAVATESGARAKRAGKPSLEVRLEEWKPAEKHYQLAEQKGRDYEWVAFEAERYRNWNRNAKHAHKNFNAGFSNWITSEHQNGNGEARSGRNHARGDSVASAYRELRLEAIDGRLRH